MHNYIGAEEVFRSIEYPNRQTEDVLLIKDKAYNLHSFVVNETHHSSYFDVKNNKYYNLESRDSVQDCNNDCLNINKSDGYTNVGEGDDMYHKMFSHVSTLLCYECTKCDNNFMSNYK